MPPLRQEYDVLFQTYLLDYFQKQPLYQLMTGPPRQVREQGFFGFLRDNYRTPEGACFSTLQVVLRQIQASDPQLASHILEQEVEVIGLKRTAILSAHFGIAINPHHLFENLAGWIDRLEAVKSIAPSELPFSMTEFFGISESDRLFPLYPALIFNAREGHEQALVKRLFALAPLTSLEVNALQLHTEFNPQALALCACEHDSFSNNRLFQMAVHLGLANQLRGDREPGCRFYAPEDDFGVDSDALLAQFLSPDHQAKAIPRLGEALMFSRIEWNEGVTAIHSRLVNYLNSLGSDAERSHALNELAGRLAADFDAAPDDALVNLKMGSLIFRLMADFANKDPGPLNAALGSITSKETPSDLKSWLQVMVLKVWFSDEIKLSGSAIRGQYSPEVLDDLISNGLVAGEGNNLIVVQAHLDRLPEAVHEHLSTALVDLLCDASLRKEHKISVSTRCAQQIVDAGIFQEKDWLRISRNRGAAEIMCKAQLTAEILDVAGERMQELALGSALGL